MTQLDIFFQIIVIVYSVILHEIAHGYAAYFFGDKTAYYQGRLTLNPIPHIDIYGSIIVPAVLILSGSSILAGWAKPVPVAEHNLNPYKLGSFVVSFAGVFVNIILSIVFMLVGYYLSDHNMKQLCAIVSVTNMGLAIFNLIPVPPADGYRIASLFLPWNIKRKIESIIQNNFLVTIIAAIFIATAIFQYIFPHFYAIIVNIIFNLR
jgi:Zn-dependent protease